MYLQLGFCILELSKLHMYKTYATLKDYFGERMRMCYTDTDAFIMHIKSDDLFVELKSQPALRDLIDFSVFPANHPSGVSEPNDPRAGVVGYFKDECSGNIITELVAIKPKAYSFTTCDATLFDPEHPDAPPPAIKHKQIAKGIARATIKQKLRHDTYLEMFREGELQRLANHAIRSKLHRVYTLEVQKRGLHPYDDKRYLLDNLADGSPNPNTHAYGHYAIPVAATVLDETEPGTGLVVSVRPPRESVDKCKDKRYKRKNKQVQKKLAGLEMAENESDWEYDGDGVPDGDAQGELHGAALAQAERAAAARPGLAVRMGDVIERLMVNAAAQSRDPQVEEPQTEVEAGAEHFEGEAEAGDASEAESDWQPFPWEQPVSEPDENEENVQPEPKRRAVRRPAPESPVLIPLSPVDPNRAGPSGWHAPPTTAGTRARTARRIVYSSDEEEAEAGSAQLVAEQETAHRREKRLKIRRAARQFIETMAQAEGEADSEQELESDDESTASDDSFIVGNDVCD